MTLPQLLQPSFFWTPWGDFFQHYCHIWETWCVILHWRSRCYFSLSLPSFLGAYTHMFHQHKTLALTFTQHIYHRGVDVRTLFLSMAQTLKEQFLLLFPLSQSSATLHHHHRTNKVHLVYLLSSGTLQKNFSSFLLFGHDLIMGWIALPFRISYQLPNLEM